MGKTKKETTKKNVEAKEEKEIAKTKKVEKKKEVKKDTKKDKKKIKKEKKVGLFKRIFDFFKGVKNEMSKVSWPSKKNMVKYTIATLFFIIFFAIFFYLVEVFMAWLKAVIVII